MTKKNVAKLLVALVLSISVHAQVVERYALYIASNEGGGTRETLKYAISDARRLATTMIEIGGVKPENTFILSDPKKADIDSAFETVTAAVKKNLGFARRTELIFYYSGHSDEKAFLLGDEIYGYSELKIALASVPTDVHVVMLDSCFSGNFIRLKGGTRDKPFLLDDASIVQGHAYLSSSSESEASQESDRIQASFFTQSLVTGLRGVADTSGDGKVSLNELYHYAFNDTLSQTEKSQAGPQHPSYNITLVGSGDLVLTDLGEAESLLIFPKENEGRYFIRTIEGFLVSEISKIRGTELSLAVPAGSYTIVLLTPLSTEQATVTVYKNQRLILDSNTFGPANKFATRSRGDEEETKNTRPETNIWHPFTVSIFPGVMFPGNPEDNAYISAGAFMAENHDIKGIQANSFAGDITGTLQGIQTSGFMASAHEDIYGIQASGFMNTAGASVFGVQTAGFMNIHTSSDLFKGVQAAGFSNSSRGGFDGLQAAGFMNTISGNFRGVQASGFMNTTTGTLEGVQAAGFLNVATKKSKGVQASGFLNVATEITGLQIGVINVAKSNTGVPLGLFNIIYDGVISPAAYIDTEGTWWAQYQGGTRYFFTSFLFGTQMKKNPEYHIAGFGIGARPLAEKKLSIDIEAIGKQIIHHSSLSEIKDLTIESEKLMSKSENEQKKLSEVDPELNSRLEKATEEYAKAFFVPSIRLTLNIHFAKHFSLFTATSFDIHIPSVNDMAFTIGKRAEAYPLFNKGINIYPSFAFGVKF